MIREVGNQEGGMLAVLQHQGSAMVIVWWSIPDTCRGVEYHRGQRPTGLQAPWQAHNDQNRFAEDSPLGLETRRDMDPGSLRSWRTQQPSVTEAPEQLDGHVQRPFWNEDADIVADGAHDPTLRPDGARPELLACPLVDLPVAIIVLPIALFGERRAWDAGLFVPVYAPGGQ